jgi:hypothetical protein
MEIGKMTNLYMIKVFQTKSGKTRRYRIFSVTGPNHELEDCTAHICKLSGTVWNNKYGTYDSNEAYSFQDAPSLQETLQGVNKTYMVTSL